MEKDLRKSGIELIGDVPWGTHFCQFYQNGEDLLDTLVPYFKNGLLNNEFCMWVTAHPVGVAEAKQALKAVLPDVERYLEIGQLEIIPYNEWYTLGGTFNSERVLGGWVERLHQAVARGYGGLRLTGNTFWLEKSDWHSFTDYEHAVDSVLGQYKMLALCTYSVDRCGVSEIADVISNHQFALIKRSGQWEIIESSDRKRSYEALTKSEARYRALFENMPTAFAYHQIVVDEENRPVDYIFLEINDAFGEMTGLRREDIIGRKVTEVLPGIEHSEFDWIGTYGRVALTGEGVRFEQYAEPLDRWYSVTAYNPAQGHFVALFTDITERKKAEAERERLLLEVERHAAELDAANKELESFSYSVSHDLRAPLRGIDGFGQALLEDYGDRLDDQGKDYLQVIRHECERLARLIDDMLKLARITRSEMRREPVDLSGLAMRIAEDLRKSQTDRQVEFFITPGLMADGDAGLLRMALENLLGNAWKFTSKHPKAKIEFGVTTQDGKSIYFVRDDGAGFDMEYSKKLFEAFQRLHRENEFPGTGIGLATVQRTIKRHGGQIWAEGQVDKGATFYFTLP